MLRKFDYSTKLIMDRIVLESDDFINFVKEIQNKAEERGLTEDILDDNDKE